MSKMMRMRMHFLLTLALLPAAVAPAAAAVYVSGMVYVKGSDQPAFDVLISVYKPDGSDPILERETLPNGAYVLGLPAPGKYRFHLNKSECQPLDESLTVPPAGLRTLQLSLSPVPSLLELLHDDSPDGRAFREQIAHGTEDLAAARKDVGAEAAPGPLANLARFQAPLPPADQNAAGDYQKLGVLFQQKPIRPDDDLLVNEFAAGTPTGTAPERTRKETRLRQVLLDHQDVMDLIHRAGDKPSCVFQRDWAQGTALRLPEYNDIREAERLLAAESYLLVRDGQSAEAVDNQARGYRIAAHAAGDPVLIAYLVGRACESMTTASLARILDAAGTQPSIAARVQHVIGTGWPHMDPDRATAFELSIMAQRFDDLRRASPQDWREFLSQNLSEDLTLDPPGHITGQFTPEDQQSLLRLIDEVQARSLCLIGSLKQKQSARLLASPIPLPPAADTHDPTALIESYFTGTSAARIAQRDRLSQAMARAVLAGAAVLARRVKTGQYPEKLQDPPTDPFTGAPLHYRREPGGFVVYSVGKDGENGHFDGGYPGMDPDRGQAYFRYP